MFQKFIAHKSIPSKVPEYTGFSLIVVKPNENHVEPERAAVRLKKGLATLIYAQQWCIESIPTSASKVYTNEIAGHFSRILERLEDRSAIWHSAGEKLRPVNVFLDLYGRLYDALNCLQNAIKSLATQPLRVIRDKTTIDLIARHVQCVQIALKELQQVMEALPRHHSSPMQSNSRDQLTQTAESDISEDEDEEMHGDSRFGILLSDVTTQDIAALRRKAQRKRRQAHASHSYIEHSSSEGQANDCSQDRAPQLARPPIISWQQTGCVLSPYQNMEVREFKSADDCPVLRNAVHQADYNLDSGDSAISMTPRTSEDSITTKFADAGDRDLIDAQKHVLLSKVHQVSCSGMVDVHDHDSSYDMADDEFDDFEEACATTVYTVAKRVSLSNKSRIDLPFQKPIMLQKHKRNESGISFYQHRNRHDSVVSELERFELSQLVKHEQAGSDTTDSASKADSGLGSASVSLASTQSSPISKFVQIAGLQ